MKNTPTPSLKDKIAFFDTWVMSNMAVDPKVVRAQASKKANPPSVSSEIGQEESAYVTDLRLEKKPDSATDLGTTEGSQTEQREVETSEPEEQPLVYQTNPVLPRNEANAQDVGTYVNAVNLDSVIKFDEDAEDEGEEDNKTGLVGLPLGQKYVGEDKGEGWQKGRKILNKPSETKYYTEKQKDESKVDFSATGKAESDSDTLDGTVGYVIDPKTGDTHQFTEGVSEKHNRVLSTHHSTPLAGGDVAGAGNMKFDDGQLRNINDRSGHYKPGGMFTFQAVRAVNMANMSEKLKDRLRKTQSESKEGGEAENADTVEQLIATEVQKERILFVEAMDEEQANLEEVVESFSDKEEKAAAFKEMQEWRARRINEFQQAAREIEDELREYLPQNPLIDGSKKEVSLRDKTLPPQVKKLAETRDAVRKTMDERRQFNYLTDVSDLEEVEKKLSGMIEREGFETTSNKETTVSLLGKAGMPSEQEYADLIKQYQKEFKDSGGTPEGKDKAEANFSTNLNRSSALKQLKGPLGEEAFAELLKSGDGAVAKALEQHGLEGNAPGSVDKLKALLGEERVGKLSEDEIVELSTKHKVVKIDKHFDGVEMVGFEVGKKSQETITGQQFLQTGGNEGQIRTKGRLLDEIKDLSTKIERGEVLAEANSDQMQKQLVAEMKKKTKRDELTNEELEDIESFVKKQLETREKIKKEMAPQEDEAETLDKALEKDAKAREKEVEDLIASTMNNPEIKRSELKKKIATVQRSIKQEELSIKINGPDSPYSVESIKNLEQLEKSETELANELKELMK